MKNISEIKINRNSAVQFESDQQSTQIVDHVFTKLKGIFPAWGNAIRSEEMEVIVKREWLIGLVENKIITHEQLNRGFSKARLSEKPFFPSCGQFIKWCQPEQGRINEAMYQRPSMLNALPKYTSEEYEEINTRGVAMMRRAMSGKLTSQDKRLAQS